MACRVIRGPDFAAWVCDIDLHASMAALCEEEERRRELDADLKRQRDLDWEEPEVAEVEQVPVHLVPDWARG